MDIKNSIVAIVNDKGKIVGTGFLAGQNLIVTCAHVVEQATAGLNERVTIRFSDNSKTEATVDQPSFSPTYERDVALLRVASLPQGITPLPLGNAAGSAGHDFYAYGYAIVTDVQGIGARGKIVDIVDNGRLVQLASQEPDHGMSGGPVLDEQRRVVIGMVTKGKGFFGEDKSVRNIFTTFAISVEVIREVCPELRLTEICPYRSLDVFNEEDAPFFFGREKVVQKLLDSLKREPRFLAVLGPSGSGKSSVVRAGLIPALRQGKVPGSQKWEIVTIRPANDPFEQLAGAGFINPKAGLNSSVKTWLSDRPEKTRLVLFIDQFEEVLVSTPKDIRQKFIAELEQLINAPLTITVALSLRDDFYSRFLQDVSILAGWLERGLVNIPPVLEQDDLRAMIFEPARSIGLTFDEGLENSLVEDACETDLSKGLAHSTILPLLEFSLTLLWELRKDGRLTHEGYKNIGRITGSLSQWVDRIYSELNPGEQKVAEQVFCGLIHLGDTKEKIPNTRRVIPIAELARGREKDNIRQVIEKLIQHRLLSVHRDYENGEELIEIIHDALLSQCELVGNWIEEFRNREQKTQKKRKLIILFVGILIVAFLLMLSIVAWGQRNSMLDAQKTAQAESIARSIAQEREQAQRQIALSKSLADQSRLLFLAESQLFTGWRAPESNNSIVATLLAIESVERNPTFTGIQALISPLISMPKVVATNKFSGGGPSIILSKEDELFSDFVISPDRTKVIKIGQISQTEYAVNSWDTKDWKQIGTDKISIPEDIDLFKYPITISKNAKWLAFISDEGIELRQTDNDFRKLLWYTEGSFLSLQFSSDSRKILAVKQDGTIKVWDTESQAEIWTIIIPSQISSVSFDGNGSIVAITVDNNDQPQSVYLYNTKTSYVTKHFIGRYLGSTINDDHLALSDEMNNIHILTSDKDELIINNECFLSFFSHSGKFITAPNIEHGCNIGGNFLRTWDPNTQRKDFEVQLDGQVWAYTITDDGDVAAISTGTTVYFINLVQLSIINKINSDFIIDLIAISPDRSLAVIANRNPLPVVGGNHSLDSIVVDLITGEKIARIPHDDYIDAIFFYDNNILITSDAKGNFTAWNIRELWKNKVFEFQHDFPAGMTCLSFYTQPE